VTNYGQATLFGQRRTAELQISGGTPTLPGSAQAVAAGCTCNPRRNNHGLGHLLPNRQVLLVISFDCPLHHLVTAPRPAQHGCGLAADG
jgi:hypothetical protein